MQTVEKNEKNKDFLNKKARKKGRLGRVRVLEKGRAVSLLKVNLLDVFYSN